MNLSPIALFAYNRPEHTRKTVEALALNDLAPESDLFVFSDGLKNPEDKVPVAMVRDYVRGICGFRSVTVVERERNWGLSRSIILGVTEIVNRFGRIVVLEDDMVTSKFFLCYMNEALELYAKEDSVISIHGYLMPVNAELPETFFLLGADCWGWGTWKRGWDLFESDGAKLLNELKTRNLEKRFDYNGTYNFSSMLKEQVRGNNDSWAVRWYAAALLNNKLTLYPGKSLVQNIGCDDSGTNCNRTNAFQAVVDNKMLHLEYLKPEENKNALIAFQNYFNSIKPPFFIRFLIHCKDFFIH